MEEGEKLIEQRPFKYPDAWSDDKRMNVLFSPFRLKSLNPIAWDSKLKFWESMIMEYCEHRHDPTFTTELLKKAFNRKGMTPNCLETVVDEMLRAGKIAPDYEYSNWHLEKGQGYLQWLVAKVMSSFLSKPNIQISGYVHRNACERIANDILKRLLSQRTRMFDINKLSRLSGVNEKIIMILLRPLVEANLVAIDAQQNPIYIKLKSENEQSVNITIVDKGVNQLEAEERYLNESIEKLERDKGAAFKEVKECLAAKRKQSAKMWLRRRNELEKWIDKRTAALENVRCLLEQIHQSTSDAQLLGAYKAGVGALKESLRIGGLTEVGVENTMNELHEICDISNEIEKTLSQSLAEDADEDLEGELEGLLEDLRGENSPPPSVTNILPNEPEKIPQQLHVSKELLKVDVSETLSLPNVPEIISDNEDLILPEVPCDPLTNDDILEKRLKALAI